MSVNAIAYVLGFVVLFMPAGIGVRDIALQLLLAVELKRPTEPGRRPRPTGWRPSWPSGIRLLGTTAEIVMAGVLYYFAPPAARRALRDEAAARRGPG